MAAWRLAGITAAGGTLLAVAAGMLIADPAAAGPVVCSTSLEAPQAGGFPVEVTRCGPITTTAELIERRSYSYTAPFARGVDVTHQVTDLLGIAMGGGDGSRVMGFGFPDQTIVWDGSALEATTRVLLEAQSAPLPWRTADRSNGFCQGLPAVGCGVSASSPVSTLIRGLW